MENIRFENPSPEYCSHCEAEVNVTHLFSECPNCGEPIVACSQCICPTDSGCAGCKDAGNFKRVNNYLFAK